MLLPQNLGSPDKDELYQGLLSLEDFNTKPVVDINIE